MTSEHYAMVCAQAARAIGELKALAGVAYDIDHAGGDTWRWCKEFAKKAEKEINDHI